MTCLPLAGCDLGSVTADRAGGSLLPGACALWGVSMHGRCFSQPYEGPNPNPHSLHEPWGVGDSLGDRGEGVLRSAGEQMNKGTFNGTAEAQEPTLTMGTGNPPQMCKRVGLKTKVRTGCPSGSGPGLCLEHSHGALNILVTVISQHTHVCTCKDAQYTQTHVWHMHMYTNVHAHARMHNICTNSTTTHTHRQAFTQMHV